MEDSADDGCNSSQSKKRKIDEKITIINDPIWGPIELHPLCIKIIDTPQFQRLRHIKQLGGCSFVYPGACHSRFEHSIGTSHLARMMGEELQKKHSDKIITNEEILCLEVAGLCHDLGHGPFSHVFDQQFQAKCNHSWTHEDLSIEMVDEIFKSIKLSKEEENDIGKDGEKYIKTFIKPPKDPKDRPIQKPFLYEIIANEENKIDVDKWDYFSRDCHMMGLHHNFQCKRSIKLARIVEDHISFPKSEYFNLFDMFYTRFTLHRRAYKHPVVKAVEMMIADAFFKADNNLTFPSSCQSLSKSTENMDAYQWVTDDVLQQIRRIELDPSDSTGDVKASQDIIDRIYRRDLYKLIGEKRVKWVKESVKNIAEKLTSLVNSLEQSETKTAKYLETLDDLKQSETKTSAMYWETHEDLEQSKIETARLRKVIDVMLKTDQVPEAKTLIQNGSLKDYVAKKLSYKQVPEALYEIDVVEFSYGSGRDNPMKKVKFHKKIAGIPQQNTSTYHYESVSSEDMDEKKSDMFPTTFEQIYVRLYWKGDCDRDTEQLQEWKKTLEKAFLAIKEYKSSEGSKFKGELVNI